REYGKDGNPTGKTYNDVSVDENGDFYTINKDKTTILTRADGTQEIQTAVSSFSRDREGQITSALDMRGEPPREWFFEYAGIGELIHVTNPDGSSISNEGDPPVWREYDKDGKPTGQTYEEVSTDFEKGELFTKHNDGNTTVASYTVIAKPVLES